MSQAAIEIKTTLPGGAELTVRGDDIQEVVQATLLTSRAWRDQRNADRGLPVDDEPHGAGDQDGTM